MLLIEPQLFLGLDTMPKKKFLNEYKFVNPETGIDPLMPFKIIKSVAQVFGLEAWQLCSQSRKREIHYPRLIAIYAMKRQTALTLKQIGVHFGGRDHSTIIYAVETYESLIDTKDKEFKTYLDKYTGL